MEEGEIMIEYVDEKCEEIVKETIEKIKSIPNASGLVLIDTPCSIASRGIVESENDWQMKTTLNVFNWFRKGESDHDLIFIDILNHIVCNVFEGSVVLLNGNDPLCDRIFYKVDKSHPDEDCSKIIFYSVGNENESSEGEPLLIPEVYMSFITFENGIEGYRQIVQITKLKMEDINMNDFIENMNSSIFLEVGSKIDGSDTDKPWWVNFGDFGERLMNALVNDL